MSTTEISKDVAFFLQGLYNVPERIAVGPKHYGLDRGTEAILEEQNSQLRSLILPFLTELFSNPANEICQKAADYAQDISSATEGGTCHISFEGQPEKIAEVLGFLKANGIILPDDLQNIRNYFTF